MPRTRECDYCGADIEPGTGTMYVRTSGTTIHFCSSKCENNADLGRDARNLEWTEAGRETTAAEDAEADAAADEAAADTEVEATTADEDAEAESEADDEEAAESEADEDAEADEADEEETEEAQA